MPPNLSLPAATPPAALTNKVSASDFTFIFLASILAPCLMPASNLLSMLAIFTAAPAALSEAATTNDAPTTTLPVLPLLFKSTAAVPSALLSEPFSEAVTPVEEVSRF